MRFAGVLLVVGVAACEGGKPAVAPKKLVAPSAASLELMKRRLREVEDDCAVWLYLQDSKVRAVRELLDREPRATWWQWLTPVESFFLFEVAPDVASRAPSDARATAYCTAIEKLPSELWGTPGAGDITDTERPNIAHAVRVGASALPCLDRLFDNTDEYSYTEGDGYPGHTTGDTAAGIAAKILDAPYDWRASDDERATQRQKLRELLRRSSR